MKDIMNKNNTRRVFALFLFLSLGWAGFASATVLNVPQRYQEKDQWCWAGVSQALLEYYGTFWTQTQIAQYGTGGVNSWNWLWGNYYFGDGVNRRGIDMILSYFAGLPTYGTSSSLPKSTVESEINSRKPFVIRWGWDSGGGHFVVGKGIEGNSLYLMDPWYGPTINTYEWVVRGGSHTWTHTLSNYTAGPSPDLVIQASSASRTELDPGQGFTFSATVHNQGAAAAAATVLRYYRSEDNTISTADTALGTDSIARLAAGASSSQSISLSAPQAYGVYWLGACVDSVALEESITNNCSAGVKITVVPSLVLTPVYHVLLSGGKK